MGSARSENGQAVRTDEDRDTRADWMDILSEAGLGQGHGVEWHLDRLLAAREMAQ